MPGNDKYTVHDLFKDAIDAKPLDFEQGFNQLMLDKVRSAVDDKKLEIASSLFKEPETDEKPE